MESEAEQAIELSPSNRYVKVCLSLPMEGLFTPAMYDVCSCPTSDMDIQKLNVVLGKGAYKV